MKSIQLTKPIISKIHKLCKNLFPEYLFISFSDLENTITFNYTQESKLVNKDKTDFTVSTNTLFIEFQDNNENSFVFHWCEFLHCVVAAKLCMNIPVFYNAEELNASLDEVIEFMKYDN